MPSWLNTPGAGKKLHIHDASEKDPQRYNRFAICREKMVFDYNKNRIDEAIMQSLYRLAGEYMLDQAIEAMFNDELINETEGWTVLHTALRVRAGSISLQSKPIFMLRSKFGFTDEKLEQELSTWEMESLYFRYVEIHICCTLFNPSFL